VQSDGKIVAGTPGHDADFSLVRFNSDGTLDNTFGVAGVVATDLGGNDSLRDLALQVDGKVVAIGTSDGGSGGFVAVRYNEDGTLDNTFDDDGITKTRVVLQDYAESVAVQDDGRIVVAGRSYLSGESDQTTVVRLNSDGSLDTSFDSDGKYVSEIGPNTTLGGRHVALGDNSTIIVATSDHVATRNQVTLLRLTQSGAPDATFGDAGAARYTRQV
jgi:uncharacterized delta-60 repeat protein